MFKSFQSNVAANYTLATQPICTTGAWQVFAATHKKSGKAVSVFVFDRKTLEIGGFDSRSSSSSSSSSQRKVQNEVVERLKKEAGSLARLRHPSVLELAEPVEETRTGLIFATEPVAATLSGLLADKDAEEGTGGRSSKRSGSNGAGVELDELEIQKGLQQIAKGLEFLHESAGLVHGNLTPEAIYINGKSDWKVAALGFSGPPDSGGKAGAGPPISLSELLYNDPRLPPSVQLNMDYTSPDFVLDNTVSFPADMFSLGLIVIALYNSPHRSPVRTHGNASTYKKIFSTTATVPTAANNFLVSKTLPQQVKSQVLPRLITRRATNRMNAREFQQSAFFDNVLVSTLQFLDTLPAKTPNEKSQFMRGLPRILDQFPRSVLEKKLLPGLLEETKDKDLLGLVLGNVFKIMQLFRNEGQRAFTERVVPKLREVFLTGPKNDRDSLKEAGLFIILENLALITENCDGKVFKDDILPIYALGLETPTSAVVDKTLTCLPVVLPKLDFSTIKNELFPIVATVFAKTSSLMIKVRGLDALNTLCGGKTEGAVSKNSSSILDKYTVQEKVVPLVKAIKTKEPAVMMASLALFTSISNICDYDFMATNLLPIAWSFSLGPLLNLEQFNRYMDLIRNISQRIQQEHTRKLRELATNSADQANGSTLADSSDLMSSNTSDDIFGTGAGQDDFTALVLGKKVTSPAQSSWDLPSRPSMQSTLSISSPVPTTSSGQAPWSSGVIQQPQTMSRAITPDSMLGSIPSLQPLQPQRPGIGVGMGVGLQPAMQPANPTTANPWTTPSSPPIMSQNVASNQTPSFPSGNIDWTKARQAQLPTALQPTSYMTSLPQIQQTQSPPPPPQQQQHHQQQQRQHHQQPKTGLDRYESLI